MNTFLDQLRLQDDAHGAETQVWLGLGQCIEHYGTGEAYLSVLTALGQLCREPAGKRFIRLLQQHAPAWLVQMPTLLTDEELATLQRKTVGVTKERMLREIAEALEVMTQERPVVFVFEDLHWSDPSTLDLLAFVARRSQPARVLIIGTYRPAEVLTTEHPLRAVVQELQLHKQCEELRLEPLSKADVVAYLAQRIAMGAQPSAPLQDLASVIRQRTEGNPLFMVNVVDELLARRDLESATVEINVPATIRQMIERQFEQLPPEDQSLIETASVTGIEFSAATVAAGNEAPVEDVERHCTALARRGQFLHPAGVSEWPDGTIASRYGFQHALYQEVIYDRVTAAQRITLHRRIGERIETAYGKQAKEISAALAYHYGRSGNAVKAVDYLQLAGEQAVQRSANVEAINHFTTALELLKTLPDNTERTQQELTLQLALGIPLIATKGNAASEVGAVYTRARELCQQVGETLDLFSTLMGLLAFYMMRAEVQTARELAEQSLSLAQRMHSPTRLMWAHLLLGQTLFLLGEFSLAQEHVEQGIALYDAQKHNPLVTGAVQDPGVSCLCFAALALRSLGYSDQAQRRSREALTLAQELSHPYSLVYALYYSARLNQFCREGQAAQEQAEVAIALSGEQGFPYWLAVGTILRGWALAEQGRRAEGISQMRQGLAALQAAGSNGDRTYYLAMLADAYGKVGQTDKGPSVLAEALTVVDNSGERFYEAELYRLKGQLTLAQEGSRPQAIGFREKAKEAEACFHKAINIARKQQAKSWELRAVMSLSRLWQSQGKKDEAHKMLSEIYNWFTEGFDTKDLQEAKALLEELRGK